MSPSYQDLEGCRHKYKHYAYDPPNLGQGGRPKSSREAEELADCYTVLGVPCRGVNSGNWKQVGTASRSLFPFRWSTVHYIDKDDQDDISFFNILLCAGHKLNSIACNINTYESPNCSPSINRNQIAITILTSLRPIWMEKKKTRQDKKMDKKKDKKKARKVAYCVTDIKNH